METMRPESTNDDDGDKLIPEWGADADDQVIGAGLVVFAAVFLLLFGWNWLRGDDDGEPIGIDTAIEERAGSASLDLDAVDLGTPVAAAVVAADGVSTTSTAAAATSSAQVTTTEAVTTSVPSGPDLDGLTAALTPEPGAITGVVIGSAVTLTGFVADGTEEEAAIDAASAVDGVESVTSELVLLEPAVAQVLADEGVVVATVDGVGTEITVTGTLQSESDRAPTITAAGAVDGVTSIIDRLEVSVADDLNALPTIPFATGSATILPEGRAIVAEAATLIGQGDGAVFEVQGYTDRTGDDRVNLELSEARAAAVVDALVAAGIDPTTLTARGLGETDQFASGTSADALAANRVVRFLQTD